MALKMTPRQSSAAAVVLFILASALAIAILTAPPIWLHVHYNRYIDLYSDQLVRYQRVADTRAGMETKLAAVKAREPRRLFLKNAGPALAASEIQDITKNLIEGNGGKLISMQIPPHKDDGRFRQVTVNVQMSASTPALRSILHALENAQPALFIDNLAVRSNQNFGYRPNPGIEPEMFIQLDLSGFAVAGS
jgi:general secretion pathway protein M